MIDKNILIANNCVSDEQLVEQLIGTLDENRKKHAGGEVDIEDFVQQKTGIQRNSKECNVIADMVFRGQLSGFITAQEYSNSKLR